MKSTCSDLEAFVERFPPAVMQTRELCEFVSNKCGTDKWISISDLANGAIERKVVPTKDPQAAKLMLVKMLRKLGPPLPNPAALSSPLVTCETVSHNQRFMFVIKNDQMGQSVAHFPSMPFTIVAGELR
jgi:hypothetical protein